MNERSGAKSEVWEWTKALVIAIALALLIRQFLFAPFVVDGQSMMPNMHHGERLIVNKIIYYLDTPDRGDVVVFHATERKDYIKRVIGLPGDTIELIDDKLIINGEPYPEPYLQKVIENADMQGVTYNNRDYGPVKVPAGHVVVFGDNRSNSQDSRDLGPIPLDSVVGRADVVFWPLEYVRFIHD